VETFTVNEITAYVDDDVVTVDLILFAESVQVTKRLLSGGLERAGLFAPAVTASDPTAARLGRGFRSATDQADDLLPRGPELSRAAAADLSHQPQRGVGAVLQHVLRHPFVLRLQRLIDGGVHPENAARVQGLSVASAQLQRAFSRPATFARFCRACHFVWLSI
jgi:hypothetical protein